MSEKKDLKMNLHYKGTVISYINEGMDFKNKFFIGTDRLLSWHLFDGIKFPKKHLFLKKAKDKYKLMLTKGMDVSVKMGEQVLNTQELRDKKLLVGNTLALDPNLAGQISLSDDWKISFEYKKPFKKVITPEQKAAMKLYQRFPELTKEQKTLRVMGFIAVLLMLIIGFQLERYELIVPERTTATLVRIDVPVQVQETQPVQRQETVAAQDVGEATEAPSRPAISERLAGFAGGSLDPGDVIGDAPQMAAVLVGERIQRRGLEGGGGIGPGPGGGLGDGTGGTSGFERRTGEITGGAVTSGSAADIIRHGGVRMDGIGGTDIQILSTGELQGAIARAVAARQAGTVAPVVDERTPLEELTDQQRTIRDDLNRVVDNYWPQIESIIREERTMGSISGRFMITLYIRADGTVEAPLIEPQRGSLYTDSFIQKASSAMMTWRFRATGEQQTFRFTRRVID